MGTVFESGKDKPPFISSGTLTPTVPMAICYGKPLPFLPKNSTKYNLMPLTAPLNQFLYVAGEKRGYP